MTAARVLAAVAVALWLGGCSVLGWFSSPNDLDSITLVIPPAVNQNTPVALDIVFVTDQALVGQLQGYAATDWWANRDSVTNNFPGAVSVLSYEVAPGQKPPKVKLPDKSSDAVAIFAYALYQTPGPHRARLESFGDAVVTLGQQTLTVTGTR